MDRPATDAQKQRKPKEPRPPKAPKEEQGGESPAKPADGEGASPSHRRHERPPRNDDWKIELEKTMTADTKIPPMPKDEDLLKKPDQAAFNAALEKIAKKIEKNFAEMDEIRKQERDLREEIFNKNNSEFVELKKLGEQRRELGAKMDVNKKLKEETKAQIEALEDKKGKFAKKGVSGKVLSKEKLEEIIAEKERDYKNSLKTSADERKHLDEISKLKESMRLANEVNKVQTQIDALFKKNKEVNAANNELRAQMDAIRAKADAIRAKLGLADKKEEGQKEGEKKEEEKKEKPKRELTQEEKDLQAKRQALFDQINKLKDQKADLRDRNRKESDAYYKQQEEIYKIKFMTGLLKKIKYVEQQKRFEADRDKREKEQLDYAKSKVSAKFNEDIEICENLLKEIAQLELREKMLAGKFGGDAEAKAEVKIDDKVLKEANLVVLKPKRDEEEGVQPGQRKLGKKGKKAEAPKGVQEEKLDLAAATLQNLAKMGITVPTKLEQLEKTVQEIREKKEGFCKLRDDAIAKMDLTLAKEGKTEEAPAEEVLQEDKKEEKAAAPEKKKEIKLDEASFPALE